jgi:hypothetical protein
MGLYRTDSNTPIIRQITIAALKLGIDLKGQPDNRLVSWWARFEFDKNWPQLVVEDEQAFLETWFKTVDVTPLFSYLDGVTQAQDLLSMPTLSVSMLDPPKAHKPTVVNEEFVMPDPDKAVRPEVKPVDATHLPCWNFTKNGHCNNGDRCRYFHGGSEVSEHKSDTDRRAAAAKAGTMFNPNWRPTSPSHAPPVVDRRPPPAQAGVGRFRPALVNAAVRNGQPVARQVQPPLSRPCFDYAAGKCSRGAACRYSHVKVCQDYVSGSCGRGLACKFAHVHVQSRL